VASRLISEGVISEKTLDMAERVDRLRAMDEADGMQTVKEADSRLNWRVTFRHADWFIHIMALDKNFERFVLDRSEFKQGLRSSDPHPPPTYHYKVINHLSELKPVLDDLYEGFKRDEEERRQQERIDEAVAMAVAEERKEWEWKLAKQKEEHWAQIIVICMIVAALVWAFLSH
jgi:hypothetical protein